VRFHGLFHNGKTQTYTCGLDIPASPEAFKYPLSLFDWNPWTTVGDAHAAVQQHLDRQLFVARRIGNGVFDKVSDRVLDR